MIFAPQQKVACHPRFSKYLSGEVVPIINCEISLSSICNARCPVCFYRVDKNPKEGFINWGKLLAFLLDADKGGLEAVTWSGGGEPTLHPDFPQLLFNVAALTNLKQGLYTNALLDPEYEAEHLTWIRVSKTNESWPVDHILKLRQQNKNVGLAVNYRDKRDVRDVEDGLGIAKRMDLRYMQVRPALNILGAATTFQVEDMEPLLRIDDKLLVVTPYKFSECSKDDRGYFVCEGYHFSPMIWENGTMSACMYMRHNHEYDLGNIYQDRFVDLCMNMPQIFPVAKDCQVCCKNNEMNRLISDCRKLEDRWFV